MPTFPDRNQNSITGSQFIQKISGFKSGSPERNKLIIEEFKSGNFPNFLRKFVPITIKSNNISIIYNVSPDYMSIGSDSDYVRISTDAPTSQTIADMFGCILPTKKMVDQIYQNAKTKAKPAPMSGGATVSGKFYSGKDFINQKMQHADSLEEHNRMIERQLQRLNHKPGDLVAGIKKDVVIGNLLQNKKDRVNIYGWHQEDGKAIQPESTFHEASYFDYSHSIRLVDQNCTVNIDGKSSNMNIKDVLKNQDLCNLISFEKLKSTSYNDTTTTNTIKQNITKSKDDFSKTLDNYLKILSLKEKCSKFYKLSEVYFFR